MKVGILTYHRSHNYGAYLQAYSLSHAINAMEGIECEIVNYNLKKEDNSYKRKWKKRPFNIMYYLKQDRMFHECQGQQLLSKKEVVLENDSIKFLQDIQNQYDVLVVGSDEIWRIATRGFPNIYWLPGKLSCIKMSYAASGRNPQSKLTNDICYQMKEFYTDFKYIGVRDSITGFQINNVNQNAIVHRNCDPAFLYSEFKEKEQLRQDICKRWNLDPSKKIVAVMYDREDAVKRLKKRIGKNCQFVAIYRPIWTADKNLIDLTPFEWVDVLGGCDYFVGSYFHGMIFSMCQNTPFSVIDRRATSDNIETSKLHDILSYENLEQRYHMASQMNETEWDEIAQDILCDNKIDFSKNILHQKELSLSFFDAMMELLE